MRRHLWLLLTATSALVLIVQIPLPHATAWHFFEEATDLLLSERGLHLYADRPDLQFGPLSIVAALPLTALGRAGSWAAMVLFSAVGIGIVWVLADSVRRIRPELDKEAFERVVLFAGVLFLVVWGDVAVRTAHIDDAITIAATAAAVNAIVRGRPWWAVVGLAVAGAAKPWGLLFAPLAAVLPGTRRWVRVLLVAGVAGLTWIPFVIAEPGTLDASSFEIANELSSSLRALGVSAATTPGWVRPVQLIGGTALAAALVWRGRWTAAVMAGVAVRLLIDPAANRYYTVGLVFGMLLFDLIRRPERLPWTALGAAAVLEFGQFEGFPPTLAGWGRMAVTVAVIGVAVTAAASPLPAIRYRQSAAPD
ncbi:MAG: hypothetical protein HKN80_13430 [Acidimicrobiia bacterium]|nr:hypothetical protein [Acidimicrobiia bacterium]